MSSFSSWQPLRLSGLVSSPKGPFLVKHDFTKSAYTTWVTNLTDIWSESLDRRAIIRRALNEDTSIDPSEDSEQLRILLDHVQRAVSGVDGTTRKLEQSSAGDIRLQIVSPLPAPLEPLEWPLQLSKAPAEVFTDEVIHPLLSDRVEQQVQSQSLLDALRDKDHVIDKLLDKLSSSGTDVGSIFPAAAGLKAGKQGPSRERLGDFVRGLDVFDSDRWRDRGKDDSRSTTTVEELIGALFVGPGQSNTPKAAKSSAAETDQARPSDEAITPSKVRPTAAAASGPADLSSNKTQDDDDFQKQATPPQLRLSRTSPATEKETSHHPSKSLKQTNVSDGDATTDESDDVPMASLRSRRASPNRVKSGVGGVKGLTSRGRATIKDAKAETGRSGRSSASSTELDREASTARVVVPTPVEDGERIAKQTGHDQKVRLGKIGGKPKSAETGDNVPPGDDRHVDRSSGDGTPSDKHIQNTSAPVSHEFKVKPESVGNVPPGDEREQNLEESAQEKADRRREELKRQLDERSKAPVKKKRRF